MATDKEVKKCCGQSDSNSEGTSMLTRFLQILDPAKAPLDPYNTQDILVFAKHYADLVRYYDLDDSIDWVDFENGVMTDEPSSIIQEDQHHDHKQNQQLVKYLPAKANKIITWKEFFYKDIAVVVASISRWETKLRQIKKEYNDIRKRIEAKPKKENFRELFLTIIHHLKRIDRWYQRSVDPHPLKRELEVKIKSFLTPALNNLMSYDKGMILNVADDLDLITHYETFKEDPWGLSFEAIGPDDSIYVGNTTKQKIIYALMYVDDVFNTMYKVYEEITGRSKYYWQQAIENFPSHQPHMALFISFVELFSYAKDELNDLTRRHLEFFYRDVLHLTEKPASPDSVYMIYQLAKGVDEFDLKKGTELTAGKDSLGKQLLYKTDQELVINKAVVKELKTLFLDKGSPIKNIYAASVANSADGKGEKFKDPETAWPTFGYFETSNDGDKLTGEKATFGFAIASPQFQLSGGERNIVIKLKFSKPPKGLIAELNRIDNESLKVQLSGAKEWIEPENLYEERLTNEKKAIGIVYPSERDKILAFINGATVADDIAGVEHQDGPVFDNPAKDTSAKNPFEDYDIGTDIAKKLVDRVVKDKKPFASLSELLDVDGLGLDKMSDLIYSFSDQNIGWKAKTNELYIKASIHTKQDPVVPYNNKTLKENFSTNYPICKIIFSGTPDLYEKFKTAKIESIDISVKVNGLTDIDIKTDDGPADPAKPVFLFTARPQAGSSFSVGSNEFINKKIDRLVIKGEWIGELDFLNRYHLYSGDRTNAAKYKSSLAIFYGNEWHPITTTDIQLFQTALNTKTKNVEVVSNTLLINIPEREKDYLSKAEATEANYSQIVKFTLQPLDFGHDEYPVLTAYQLANRLNENGDSVDDKKITDPDLKMIYIPQPPIAPQVKSLTMNYVSSQTLHNPNGQVFHIYPFGVTEIYPFPLLTANNLNSSFDKLLKREKETDQLIIPTISLLPQFKFGSDEESISEIAKLNNLVSIKYDDFKKKKYFYLNQYESIEDQQGNLYIGIENIVPPQNLSLLFKFADGSAYDNDSEPPHIHWSYLVNNEWLHLPQDHLITDSTYGFQTTGIILFDFPSDATNNNTILTTGLYWLCASVDDNAHMIPKLLAVIAQANQATFFDQQNDPVHYKSPLPEKTISKPLVKIPEVKTIEQPFESFDGKPGEEGIQFYQRVSERLHHKGRAITPSDYEHLILQQFPSVYKVKVLSHTDPECLCRYEDSAKKDHKNDCCCPQVAPGHVLIVAISNLRNKNAIDLLKPRTGRRTLLKIEEFLKKRVSPFVHVHAKNPKFEEVKVSFNVKFYTGIDKGFYLKKLNDDIIRYLTPWAYDSNFEILFGNKIYASKIIDFVEGLDYVDYITCFSMIHLVEGCCKDDTLEDIDCTEIPKKLARLHALIQKEKELKKKEKELREEGIEPKKEEIELSDVEKEEKKTLEGRFLNEVSATSLQAILVSAKHHCIELIEEEPMDDDCNCSEKNKKKK
ncbi:MAG TPA: hypothetical protein VGQ04_21310 [Chitinophagaceae bacterium]|jgi:hypothetical protein|nr:hypothetical protein [Chitinophagaceae bacterium]